jgi:hypothetical protein
MFARERHCFGMARHATVWRVARDRAAPSLNFFLHTSLPFKDEPGSIPPWRGQLLEADGKPSDC